MWTKNLNFDVNYVTLFVSKNSFNGSQCVYHGLRSLKKLSENFPTGNPSLTVQYCW